MMLSRDSVIKKFEKMGAKVGFDRAPARGRPRIGLSIDVLNQGSPNEVFAIDADADVELCVLYPDTWVTIRGDGEAIKPTESITGVVFDIQRYAIYDGPGIRTCVFLKGCPLRCAWCHNPESWRISPERDVSPDVAEGDPGDDRAMLGREVTVAEVLAEVVSDRPFYETSGGGLTVSGGEPTLQFQFLQALLSAAREESVHTALETCGHFHPSRLHELAENVDLFLFDLKLLDDARHVEFTGVSNARILANFKSLVTRVGEGGILARLPLVPGVNVGAEAVGATIEFLRTAGYTGRVELMPYNNTARSKWQKVGRGEQYHDYGVLSPEALDRVSTQLKESGFETFINC